MSIKSAFDTRAKPDTVNEAGGRAFSRTAEETLASFVGSGTLNGTFYTNPKEQLETITKCLDGCSVEFIAQAAVYSRTKAFMKDMPSILCAHLFCRGPEGVKALELIFQIVIDNGKMLRNYVKIILSGQFGRKNISGRASKRMIGNWFTSRSAGALMTANIGNDPTLRDILRMVRPKPENDLQRAVFGWITTGKMEVVDERGERVEVYQPLPNNPISEYEKFKVDPTGDIPKVHWQYLTALGLTKEQWAQVAIDAKLQTTLMNLNTFKRQGVFESKIIAERVAVAAIEVTLSDPDGVRDARLFPFQVLRAVKFADTGIPRSVFKALDVCLNNSLKNVRPPKGKTLVAIDRSASMGTGILGSRLGAPVSISCAEAGALFGAAMWINSDDVELVAYDTVVYDESTMEIRPNMDMATVAKLIGCHGGGTDTSAVFQWAKAHGRKYDNILIFSDSMSWASGWRHYGEGPNGSFEQFCAASGKRPKLVCIDACGTDTQQFKGKRGRMHVSGFNDSVFDAISRFCETGGDEKTYLKMIKDGGNI